MGRDSGDAVTRCLIVNADDYAMSLGVSRGILEAHARGVVTSTTALVNTPDAAADLAAARAGAPALGLGLHINLSFGRPVLPASALMLPRPFQPDTAAPPESTTFLQFVGVCPQKGCGHPLCPGDSITVSVGESPHSLGLGR